MLFVTLTLSHFDVVGMRLLTTGQQNSGLEERHGPDPGLLTQTHVQMPVDTSRLDF
jgi:hypothetical protein